MKTLAPSDVNVSGMPKIEKYSRSIFINSSLVSFANCRTDNQLLNLSTITKNECELREKKSAHIDWKGYTGISGSIGGIDGLEGWYLAQVEHVALKLTISARKLGQYKAVAARSNMAFAPW